MNIACNIWFWVMLTGGDEKRMIKMGLGGAHSSSRWNPTREQIDILEELYRQGVRTPTADQIQQITSRLKAHGHIEGKNVFYWFQNHKARQRQKQKQESMVYLSPFMHKPAPGVHSPFCLPPPGVAFYPQCPTVLQPGSVGNNSRDNNITHKRRMDEEVEYQTLQLFPLHPTGLLEGRGGSSTSSSSSETYDLSWESTTGVHHEVADQQKQQPSFDFFSHHASY